MTTIKHTLQRQVFLPSEERLVAVVHVTKVGKKKKTSFLCAAVTTEKPIQAKIYQVKQSEKVENLFKKKTQWELRELKVLDGKDSTRDTAEFDLQFEKCFKWIASNTTERNAFINCLWKLGQRYVVQKPEFVNVQPGVLEDSNQISEADRSVQQAEDIAMTLDSDYQALSSKEETDIEALIADSENAISDAEAFAQQLAKDLSVLDGANIHSIMGSEEQVLELMVSLDQALQETFKVEEKLDEYDCKLQGVKDLMEVMKDKDTLMQIKTTNHQKLLDELDTMISQLNLDYPHQAALLDADLSTSQGVSDCIVAAELLHRCMSADIRPHLQNMAAVKEMNKRFEKLKSQFAKRLSHHLNNLFIHQGNELGGGTMNRVAGDMHLPKHKRSQKELQNYAELMSWLKAADQNIFTELKKVYTNNLSRLYDKEIKEFMEGARQKLVPSKMERKDHEGASLFYCAPVRSAHLHQESRLPYLPSHELAKFEQHGTLPNMQRHSGSSSSLNKMSDAHGKKSADFDHKHSSDQDLQNRRKFDQVFEMVLCELGPWCLDEQDFCVKFFHLSGDVNLLEMAKAEAAENQKTSGTPKQQDRRNTAVHAEPTHRRGHRQSIAAESPSTMLLEFGPSFRPRRQSTAFEPFVENLGDGLLRRQSTVFERQISGELRKMMGDLFLTLEAELNKFILFGDQLDSFNSLYMLVRMSEHVINANDTGSFLSWTFANCLVQIKRSFDNFIESQIQNMIDTRVSKKSKVGILPFVQSFQDFAQQAELIYKHTERRTDLDKAYRKLLGVMFEQINRVAAESQKTPSSLVMCENYHHLFAALSQLKITCLEAHKKGAKSSYQEELNRYVSSCLGRPMENLNVFFEGIQSKVAAGVKEEEVSYQLAFSKQELRKVIKVYPGKEVKKNLESLYKQVVKQTSEEENLLQVVWLTMQDQFLKQYTHFETLIARCYPDSGITIEFTINDLLGFFSDIARSH